MTFDELVEKCLSLRNKDRGARLKFYEFLLVAETEHASLWRSAGFARFHAFLTSNAICDNIKQFRQYKAAREALGADRAKALGVDAAINTFKSSQPKQTRTPRRDFEELENENKELRAALAEAQNKVKELRAEVVKLEKRLAKYEPKPKSKNSHAATV